jgi:hypothetical protein
LESLYVYFDPATPPMPEGSACLPLDWRFLWAVAGVFVGLLLIVWLILIFLG